jgi:hypothetical protein
MAAEDNSTDIFVNVPYDKGYEPLFITLIGTLIFLGQKPRCAAEIRESGEGRLARLYKLLSDCTTSIHDLSRVGAPRFNMPFELGIACGLNYLSQHEYAIIVLDAKPRRLDRTLSDYKACDPLIHNNKCDDMIACLLDVFDIDNPPQSSQLRTSTKLLRSVAHELKREMGIDNLFRPNAYRSLVKTALVIAEQQGFLAP